MRTIWELKVWSDVFGPLSTGAKKVEIRIADDRDFSAGDLLLLREWSPAKILHGYPQGRGVYTGRQCVRIVTHVTDLAAWVPVKEPVVALSLGDPLEGEAPGARGSRELRLEALVLMLAEEIGLEPWRRPGPGRPSATVDWRGFLPPKGDVPPSGEGSS